MVSSRLLAAASAAALALANPCDIFAAAGTPCVAAHAVSRALYAAYSGPLYRVTRTSDNSTLDIGVVAAGGAANAAAQDAFCADFSCVVSIIYDQSPQRNHLAPAPPGGEVPRPDKPVNASKHQTTLAGKKVYAAFFEGGEGYRNDTTSMIATGNEEETLYMVTSGTHVNGGCCFDYGNAETSNHDNGPGTMESVYFGTSTGWGRGAGKGPWVMMDAEDGLFAGNDKVNNNNTPLTSEFVTAMVKGGANGFALKGGDATQGTLKTMYDGVRPNGYQPMKKQGAVRWAGRARDCAARAAAALATPRTPPPLTPAQIILGIGGDNSNSAVGTFFEGCITRGLSSDAADDAVQADIVAARYGA